MRRRFSRTSESGGTLISSAYKLCKKIIETNIRSTNGISIPFIFSDGDNWSGEDTRLCLKLLEGIFSAECEYVLLRAGRKQYGSGQFLKDLEKAFPEDDRLVMFTN